MLDELIRWGIERGVRRIYGGMTNEQQKARHGFQARERWFCVRAHPGLLNRALGLALDRRERSAPAPARVELAKPGY